MKRITIFALFLFAFALPALSQNCINPVNAQVFQANFNQIAIQQTNQKKLEKATVFASNNCLMTAQVKNIAQLFTEDPYRLEFCKVAYSHTFDQVNFYDVYDAFTAFSYAFRLHDYIHATTPTAPEPAVLVSPTPAPPAMPVYPNVAYPSSVNYPGRRGCNGPVLDETSFKAIAQNVFVQPTDEAKQVAIQNASNANCFDFAQLMKLVSLMQSESLRLQVMQFAYPRVYDLENYQSGIVLFTSTQMQTRWSAFASSYLTPPAAPAPPPVVCSVSTTDFNGIMTSMKAKSFPADKMSLVELLAKDRCFSVEQIKLIGKEFTSPVDKLKAFKLLYAKCADQNNYYKIVDELTYSSDKENLNTFLKNGGR